ncbi:hypothetical protein Lqua_1605, partial [Legionella quateirensis]
GLLRAARKDGVLYELSGLKLIQFGFISYKRITQIVVRSNPLRLLVRITTDRSAQTIVFASNAKQSRTHLQ